MGKGYICTKFKRQKVPESRHKEEDLLYTMRVKVGLVDIHSGEGGGMVIALLLFGDQLTGVIGSKRSSGFGTLKNRFGRSFSVELRHGGSGWFCIYSSMCFSPR
jgi:hypothetical protein